MEISTNRNSALFKTRFDESLNEYESIDIASFLLEFDRLYSTACYFLKSTHLEHDSDIRSKIPQLTQQFSDYIDRYATNWLLSEMKRSGSRNLSEELKRAPDFAPISTPQLLQEGISLKITQINYNSPLQITFKGAFPAMILAITLLGGEISASANGYDFTYKTEGIIECLEKIQRIFFSANTQKEVNDSLEDLAAHSIYPVQKNNFSEGEE
ncbi:hypothetical protein HYN73_22740 [Vibrio parahaemolyticus]|uniref:hypothetical protein n=1 Tax=Vibrio parahaemolyticus TaxID=670 RepID=UPI0004D76A9A|nr:hypothetical protein [Vibrio parahaemolyticus]ELB2283240.1 hypothetical protein [Vibrio alginolyticus]EGR1699915.1 hypothetical protein [Vibrio parahaemolyticus]MBM5193863.1 hypothetical protein [Vibrio parahaemolyticus]MBM5203101.1 hypothetical protein [Vibrio parahaemolyticus]MBM5207551.1 hypothetical protein [Vibrio parahaemolyticus]